MKVLIVFSVVIAASYGVGVKWTDFRGGKVGLPAKEADAKSASWVACETDDTLKVKWYRPSHTRSLYVAFDKKGNCAGVQSIVFESAIDSTYLSLYKQSKGLYKKTTIDGETAYSSVALFTDPKILKSGGRKMQKGEEVALGVYLRVDGKYTRISREGCVTGKTWQEQTCQSAYGVILAAFKRTSTCSSLHPFYVMYDPESDGDLTGFGWLSFHQVTNKNSFFKSVSTSHVKTYFPNHPSCLTECSSLAVMDIWLSYSDSLEASCTSSTNWMSSHCQSKTSKRTSKKKSSSSSSSSDSSDSSGSSDSSDSD